MRASKIMQQRVEKTANIEIHWNTETDEILGDDNGVTGVRVVNNKTGEKSIIPDTRILFSDWTSAQYWHFQKIHRHG